MIYVLILVAVAIVLIVALFRFGVKQKIDEYNQINKYFRHN